MLLSLRIKNYALIESEEIEFGSGLNILTGETGAGKSIILGALALALGEKANKEALRNEADEALVEAIFSIDSDEMREKLAELDVETYDDQVILTRKISATRAKAMINGESVPSQKLHMVGSLLLNIFGQHEHQTLLKKEKHMEIIDSFGGAELATLKEKVGECFERYTKLHQEYESMLSENTNREKDLLYLNHEVEEISNANLKEGEDEEVENEYRRMKNSQKIMEAVGEAYSRTSDDGASALLGSALSSLQKALEYDESLSDAYSVLSDADGLLNDFNRLMSDYISEASFDGAYFQEIESRLDLINNLKAKYGPTIEAILEALEEKQKEIEKIENFDGYLEKLKSDLAEAEKEYLAAAENLTKMREISRDNLLEMVRFNLRDLNFTNTEVEMPFERSETFRKNGLDTGELLVSLNAGEPLRPLREVASGGELSRISLAIKTCVASKEETETMIFDEVDTGISGRTAQKVAEKMVMLSRTAQIICITHLPQIACMADSHFVVEKEVIDGSTISFIKKLYNNDMVEELSRMLSGDVVTETTRDNAREMIENAEHIKASI